MILVAWIGLASTILLGLPLDVASFNKLLIGLPS
jgi:hypothetical protein